MNVEKLKRLQTQVRIGGKGTARRKKKVMHQTATTDDKKLQSSLKKLSVSTIPGIEEVNIIKDDLTVIHFNNPKAQASLSANTFAVTGHGETKKIVEMLPEILPQLGQETVVQLRMFANSMAGTKKASGTAGGGDASVGTNMLYSVEEEDDVPMLVSDFDEVAKSEAEKPTATTASSSEQPASEHDKHKKITEVKEETVEVLPTLSEEGSIAETVNAEKKVKELKSMENLNLNITLNKEYEQNNCKIKSANDEMERKKEDTDLNQENNTEKEKPINDLKKLNEPQKKNESKQQSAKQKVKTEPKSEKNLKDDKKSEKSVLNTNSLKVESVKVVKTRELQEAALKNVAVDVESDKPRKEQQKPLQQKQSQKQLKTEQQKKDKQQQQSEQKQESDQPKNLDIKENQNKVEQPQDRKTSKQENQKQQTPSPKLTQQQQHQKNNQQIKQKNKSGQQKEQNQNLQPKTDNEQRMEKMEKKPQGTKPSSAKQQEKESDEGSIEQKKGPKQASAEKQTTETTDIQRKSETQVKGSQQEKRSTALKPDASSKNNEQKQKALTLQKEKEQDILTGQKLERQSGASISKDNFVVGPEKQTKSETAIADVSIKTVALQSLQSTEKLLGIVHEITKELTVEGLKEDKEAELPIEKQLEVSERKECASVQAIDPNVQLLPANQNTVTTLAMDSVERIQEKEETKLNIVDSLVDAVEKLSSEEKLEMLSDSEKPSSSSNSGAAKEVVEANKDKNVSEKELTKETSPANILQPQSSQTLQKTLEEQLDKKSTLAGIVQSKPGTSTLVKNMLVCKEKTEDYSPISTDSVSKHLSMAEVIQALPTQISPNNTALEKPTLIEMKDTLSADVKDAKSDSTASKEEKKFIGHLQEEKVITPEASITTPENKKATTPKPKMSPPKQTKSPQEMAKQQAKTSPVKDSQKASTPADAKLKLTKPQPTQQQYSSKGNAKPMASKSGHATPTTPTTPTTPLRTSPEKTTAPNIKVEGTSKKTNSPQKQVDGAKSKQQGVAGKTVRPGGGNVSVPSGGSKKGNTSPAVNKTSANAGKKQQETSLQDTTRALSAGAAQPEAAIAHILSPPAVPATENTANSNPSPQST